MSRTVFVNGEYLPEEEAKVSVFDRGFLFADGVYEVTSVLGGKLIDFDGHAKRLQRSLSELEMKAPVETEELLEIHRELVTRNGIDDGLIYLQVTRGAADRDFAYPSEDTEPTMVLFTQAKPGLAESPVATDGDQGDLHRRPALGPTGYQDGAVAVPVHGQDDGQGRRV
jgi:D-alanine transaminase